MHISFDNYYHHCSRIIFSDAQLPLSLKRIVFRRLLLSLGDLGQLAIRLYSDIDMKHLRGGDSVICLPESPAVHDLSLSCLLFLKHFSDGGNLNKKCI